VRVAKAQDKHQLYEAVVELRAGKKYSDRTKRQRTKNKHVV
jgi:hypothetical protein